MMVSPALPSCFNYKFAVVSPLSRIKYRVADLAGDAVAASALGRLSSTAPGSGRAVLIRQEENIATGALDDENTGVLERLGRDLADGGVPVLWVTHDLAQVDRIADRRIELAHGRMVAGESEHDDER